jgi:hypothetical protein
MQEYDGRDERGGADEGDQSEFRLESESESDADGDAGAMSVWFKALEDHAPGLTQCSLLIALHIAVDLLVFFLFIFCSLLGLSPSLYSI